MGRVVLDKDAWAAVRAAYENSDEPVYKIGLRFGIGKDRIYAQAAKEGWRMRSERTVRRVQDVPPRRPDRPPVAAVLLQAVAGLTADEQAAHLTPPQEDSLPAAPFEADRPLETHAQRLERLHRIIDRLLAKLESTMAHNMTPQDQEKAAKAVTQTVAALERVSDLANTQSQVPETDGGQSHDSAEAERMRREIAERLERLSAKWLDGPQKPE